MKVNSAAQTLSSSATNAIKWCEGKAMQQFKGCGQAVEFIRMFDRVFDVLNSRNPRANNYNAPIRKTNCQFVKKFLDEACKYVKDLKGQSLLVSQRKNGFSRFPRLSRGSSWNGGRSGVWRGPSPKVCSDVQDESGSPEAVLRCCASRWRVEQQPDGVTVQICIKATDDETPD